MKSHVIILSMLFFSLTFVAHDSAQSRTEAESSVTAHTTPTSHVHACACGPIEHWFHKACVKNYNKQFSEAGLSENYDTEGLSVNLLEAIEMLAEDITFIAQDGTVMVPELNAKGKLILKMSKNEDYILCKQILKQVDTQTTLSAEELYQQWSNALQSMKSL